MIKVKILVMHLQVKLMLYIIKRCNFIEKSFPSFFSFITNSINKRNATIVEKLKNTINKRN